MVVIVVVPLVVLPLIILGRLRVTSRLAQDRLADVAVEAQETLMPFIRFKLLGGNGICGKNLTMRCKTVLMLLWHGSVSRGFERYINFLVFSGISVIYGLVVRI